MKINRIIVTLMVIFILTAGPAFSQNSIQKIQNAVNNFSEDVSLGVPFNSTIGLNWSDAYIGQLLDVPPHFGVGFSFGFTTLGIGAVDELLIAMGGSTGDIPSFLRNLGMPLPAYTIEGRIGGFVLPFDIGIKFGYLPLDFSDFGLDYLLFGLDVRYAVVKSALSPVKVSVGLGYNYLSGGVKVSVGDLSLTTNGTAINLNDTSVGFLWGSHVIELKGQVSFKLPVITPYAGTGLSVAFSHAGYEFKAKTANGIEVNRSYLESLGISGITANGFESIIETTSFNMRLFGGISFNIAMIKLDLTAMYNLTGGNFGATFGGRFQM